MDALLTLTDAIKPIYLGYEEKFKRYYFYAIKDKAPRFLVFCSYFYWGVGPQTALVLVALPEEVEQDLESFLTGRLEYEFRKLRKNSKTTTAHRVYRTPQEVIQPGSVDNKKAESRPEETEAQSRISSGTSQRSVSVRSNRSSSNSSDQGRSQSLESSGTGRSVAVPVKRHRRTKLEMEEARARESALVENVVQTEVVQYVEKTKRARTRSSKDVC